jgi:hypothetical protein
MLGARPAPALAAAKPSIPNHPSRAAPGRPLQRVTANAATASARV